MICYLYCSALFCANMCSRWVAGRWDAWFVSEISSRVCGVPSTGPNGTSSISVTSSVTPGEAAELLGTAAMLPRKPAPIDRKRLSNTGYPGTLAAAGKGRRNSNSPDTRHSAAMPAAASESIEEANFIFHKFDVNKDGQIDEDELALCLQDLQVRINGRQRKTEEEVRDWVRKELKRHDSNGDGQLSFDEFVEYYNTYISTNRRSFEDTYKVTAHLGKGAFASVKRASVRHPVAGSSSEVAVKRIQKAGVNMKLMHNEVTIWSRLDHPHLVRLLDAFETPDELILVQELMEGGPACARGARGPCKGRC